MTELELDGHEHFMATLQAITVILEANGDYTRCGVEAKAAIDYLIKTMRLNPR